MSVFLPVPLAARSSRRSTAACLLRSWVRIPPGAWMSVCCECCVFSGRGLCDELTTRPEVSYGLWCVVVCGLENTSLVNEKEGQGPLGGYRINRKKRCVFLPHLSGTEMAGFRCSIIVSPVACLVLPYFSTLFRKRRGSEYPFFSPDFNQTWVLPTDLRKVRNY